MTRDKVTLRLTLTADLRVVDPVVATSEVASVRDAVYLAVQLAARGMVAAMTLDELLESRDAVGPDFFINCRTDLFLKAPQETHDGAMLEEAIARVRAYADAGASGYFVPMLGNLDMLRRLCGESPIPINFMTYPGCPSNTEVAATGVARISHGPFPYMALMAKLEEMAREAIL